MDHKLRAFGDKERNYTFNEKKELSAYMKKSAFVNFEINDMLIEADNERDYFDNFAKYAGIITFGFVFCLPFINKLNLIKRTSLSFIPSYYIYHDNHELGKELWWNKTQGAYELFIVSNGMNEKVFV